MPAWITVVGLFAGGCAAGGTPATAPQTTPAPTTASIAMDPAESAATATTAPGTTNTAERSVEIEAMVRDLEERRLQALYDRDVEAFTALFANGEYLQRSLALFDLVEFVGEPEAGRVEAVVVRHLGDECLVAEVRTDYSGILSGGEVATKVVVFEHSGEAWGISLVGEGWRCDGPPPFSSQ